MYYKVYAALYCLMRGCADAYFVPGPFISSALTRAARDGVDVQLLLPGTNDVPWVGPLSRAGYRRLLEAGVRIFEYSGPMMHAKTAVADGYWSRIGSTNLNLAELIGCWELDLLVEDTRFGAEMEAMFEEDLAAAREIRLDNTSVKPRVRPKRRVSWVERRGESPFATHSSPTRRTDPTISLLLKACAEGGRRVAERLQAMRP